MRRYRWSRPIVLDLTAARERETTSLQFPAMRAVRLFMILAAGLVTSGLGIALDTSGAGAGPASKRAQNPIQRENALPGSPGWRLPEAPPGAVEGYASTITVQPGRRLDFHVATNPPARYRVEVYRIGWYAGVGARRVACSPTCDSSEQGTARPVPPFDSSTGYLTPGWPVTDRLAVDRSWTSGYYLAEFVLRSGPDAGRGSWAPFVVRAPETQRSAVLVQAPVNTWEAYNDWGGRSLYTNFTGVGDNHVSFDRPFGQAMFATADGPAKQNTSLPQVLEFPLRAVPRAFWLRRVVPDGHRYGRIARIALAPPARDRRRPRRVLDERDP